MYCRKKVLPKNLFLYRHFAMANCCRYCFIKFDISMDYISSGKAHGNTHKEKQMKAYRSTLQSQREISDIEKPKSAYETLRKPTGKAAAAAALTNNYLQAVYARQAVSSQITLVDSNRDELIRVIIKSKKPKNKKYQFSLQILNSVMLLDFVFCLILQNALSKSLFNF